MATMKQAEYIRVLIEKKISLWDTGNAGMRELARRELYHNIRARAREVYPDDIEARRAMVREQKKTLRANLDAEINAYIQGRRDYYASIEIPESTAEASALIDNLNDSW